MSGKFYPKIQIVDEKDNLIGNVEYFEAVETGAIRRVARVFVFNEVGQILIQKRSEHINNPLLLDQSVGGHVDEGESYLDAAIREMKEELGLEGFELTLVAKSFRTKHFFSDVFKTTIPNDTVVHFDPHEVHSIQWLFPDEITELANTNPELCTDSLLVVWPAIKDKLLQ